MTDTKTLYDFDDISEGYDRCNRLFSLGIDQRWRRRTVRLLQPQADHTVLDLCCGTGDLAFAFLKYSPVRSVVGLDLSGAMVEQARVRYEKQFHSPGRSVEWLVGDAITTGLPDRSFDFITCAFGLRNIPDRPAALAEMHRLLKPGGQAAILEFSLPTQPLIRALYRLYLGRIMPVLGGMVLGSSHPLYYLARSIERWDAQVDLAEEFRQARLTFNGRHRFTAGITTLWLARKEF